jgi:DnaJ-class molecular chaperone
MHLDHTTGEISGLVVAGRFAGRDLQSMTLDELVKLYQQCAGDDQDSAVLLEAYLDRVHGQTWRQAGQRSSSKRGHNGMTAAEAYEVLGLAPGASREAIIEAHRRLMQKVHPDRGGSDFLAANVNRAKEVLLGG